MVQLCDISLAGPELELLLCLHRVEDFVEAVEDLSPLLCELVAPLASSSYPLQEPGPHERPEAVLERDPGQVRPVHYLGREEGTIVDHPQDVHLNLQLRPPC